MAPSGWIGIDEAQVEAADEAPAAERKAALVLYLLLCQACIAEE
jgi:hypothetical protein